MQNFPSIERVYAFFCPGMWKYALEHVNECMTQPCITLKQVDEAYNTIGAAQKIVKAQFIGIYSLSTAREPLNEQASDLAADMFVAQYGHVCSLYDVMLYFSKYVLEYKGSFSQYDTTDILQQFSKKFLPWKRARLQAANTDEQPEKAKGMTVEQALVKWMAEGTSADEIREGGLYACGIVTEQMIEAAQVAIKNKTYNQI